MCSSLGWNRSSAHSNRSGSILLRRVESNSRTTMLSASSPRTSYRQRHVVPLSSPYTYFLVNRRRRCPKIEASRRRVAKSARWYFAKVFKVRDLSDFHAPIRRSRGDFISGAFPSNACVCDGGDRVSTGAPAQSPFAGRNGSPFCFNDICLRLTFSGFRTSSAWLG